MPLIAIAFGDAPYSLILDDVLRYENGNIYEGWVVNGHWRFRRTGRACAALYENGAIANQWQADTVRELNLNADVCHEYNKVLDYANTIKEPTRVNTV